METDVMIPERKIEVVIPTYNGGKKFYQVAEMLKQQVGITPNDVLIIDSCSSDHSVQVARTAGFRVQI
ncbi:glycosyltransferase, partial [Megasphaera sp.]|uniref:glycosyltransferase n=1 Tax=Megasphaera sp. TaxID=2023260 RepID=UPI004029A35A